MLRAALIAFLFTLAIPASATPEINLADDVDYSSCGDNKACKGQVLNAAYESLKAELASICQSRGYSNHHVRKASSRSLGNSVTRLTITGNCRN